MTRSVLFDTETTGLEPHLGHRVIEIAALELANDLPTGRELHFLIHPDRDIPDEASRIHGFRLADLHGRPRFHEVAEDILAFFGDDPLVAHNAPFDFGFMDAELGLASRGRLAPERMVDTLALAKRRFPGLPNSLDALCRRFGIDLSARTTHNALLDCRLLAEVYIELTGGRQRGLTLVSVQHHVGAALSYERMAARTSRAVAPTPDELAAHAAFVARLKDPVWLGAA